MIGTCAVSSSGWNVCNNSTSDLAPQNLLKGSAHGCRLTNILTNLVLFVVTEKVDLSAPSAAEEELLTQVCSAASLCPAEQLRYVRFLTPCSEVKV